MSRAFHLENLLTFAAICSNGCGYGTCAAPEMCDCSETGYDGPTCSTRNEYLYVLLTLLTQRFVTHNVKMAGFALSLTPVIVSTLDILGKDAMNV